MLFRRVLIANRGEIVRRATKTFRRLNVEPIVVYTRADETAPHVRTASRACLVNSYVSVSDMIAAARASRADAVFPGYGFLAERADLAVSVEQAGMTFIGPSSRAMTLLGDKIESKKLANKLGISTIPGVTEHLDSLAQVRAAARELGYPVVLKAASGGGGRGLRVVHHDKELSAHVEACKAEAERAFGESRLLLEKYIGSVRHIEVQVLGDRHGHLIVMPERECSIQRQYQKVLEESPSVFVDEAMRRCLFRDAITIARAVDYDSVGTVEFLVNSQTREHYFLEMNTRLQVEHPLTEAITSVDLVELMTRAAANEVIDIGRPISFSVPESGQPGSASKVRCLSAEGWALEARICAEAWSAGVFVPSTGRLRRFRLPEPHDGIRIDAGYEEGDLVSPLFDSLLAKVVAHGERRDQARQFLVTALDSLLVDGVDTTTGLLRDIVGRDRAFARGVFTTDFLKDYSMHFNKADVQRALQLFVGQTKTHPSAPQPVVAMTTEYGLVHLEDAHNRNEVVRSSTPEPERTKPSRERHSCIESIDELESPLHVMPPRLTPRLIFRGMPITVQRLLDEDEYCLWQRIHHGSAAKPITEQFWQALRAPMPGILVAVLVSKGDEVQSRQPVAILESMKMQNVLHAPALPVGVRALIVRSVSLPTGSVLRKGDTVLEFAMPGSNCMRHE